MRLLTNSIVATLLLCTLTQAAEQEAAANLPKVVLVGDSIRMGYAPFVVKQLAGKANIVSPSANGGNSTNVLNHLEEWVIREQPAVVHFNAGIHDIKKSKTTGTFSTPPEAYEANLRKIVGRLRQETKAKILFATTTPIIDDRAAEARTKRDYDLLAASIDQYNGIARRVMQELNVPVDDLSAVVGGPEDQARLIVADGVHFTAAGSEQLGAAVAAFVGKHLPATSAIAATTGGLKTDIEFAKVGEVSLTLDAFVPEGAGPFPTCILVHGGGFTKGDKQSFIKPLFEPLGRAGFAWFSINYRLAPDHRWPACADDVAMAIRWVKAHAAEYKVDPNRIALIGESAGGHLVSWAGTQSKGDTSVAAVVPFYAPHDLELQVRKREALGPSMTALLGLTKLNDDAWRTLRAASPSEQVRSGLPPYLLIHGDADAQVPYEQSPKFQHRMQAAGNICDLITIAGGAHGMGGWEKLESDYQQQLISWLNKTLAVKK